MIDIKTGEVVGYKGIAVPFEILSKGNVSNKLAIMFPGSGYTVEGPVFRYSTGIFMNKGFDVLHVNYQYKKKMYDAFTMEELAEAIKYDVATVLDKVLAEKSYENYYLIGKSLGTIAMSSELIRDEFKKAKAIWLTPLLQRDDVFHAMVTSENEGLAVIGDKDRCYIEERFQQIEKKTNITPRLIPGVNHSLEYDGDIVNSIDVLKGVISEIEQF